MTFTSYTFFFFIVIVYGLHRTLPTFTLQKLNLAIASFLFYMAWNPPYVLLLMLSTVVDWYLARAIDRSEAPGRRRFWLVLSLVSNLGMLSYFKYGHFLVQNFIDLAQSLGVTYHPPALDIILPVGISFYTFQTLSYTIDVYRREMKPATSFLNYSLFVSFFPQLVAGPIVRAADFLPQCLKPRPVSRNDIGWGLFLFIAGLFQKVVIADGLLAPIVEQVYDTQGAVSFASAWATTFAFAIQVFADFAGYSACAIGLALILGFSLPDNFRTPYAAIGFSDFWRRWHMSLSTWLRDYLYVSLGGNRGTAVRTQFNLMLTMLLGGLWHGASWNFVVWGGLHGLYLIGERWLRTAFGGAALWTGLPARLVLTGLTFLMVCITWIFFRAPTFARSSEIVAAAFGHSDGTVGQLISSFEMSIAFGVTAVMLVTHWLLRSKPLEVVYGEFPLWVRTTLVLAMILLIFMSPGEDRAFIYFQF